MKPLAMLTLCGLLPVLAACSSTPQPPQVTPVNATIKLGRVTERVFLTRLDVAQVPPYYGGGTSVGVGAASGGHGGGGVGVGFAFDLSRLFNKPAPVQQVDLFQYKVRTLDGAMVTANAPAAPGLEPGACVRVIYPDGGQEARLAPSNEC
ncbi:hypothetical protein [Cupriavidus alkaliphilus]|uniref:Lipoprotein n=1 Tax=Cupriavidus alkaliphilus TaxID=942866 RepID=A0A7W4U115_9BURK|nr:hypothetical protein [Cupriavidus alkaliphilus]MBB2915646.1 hypothetical protein [Cupriavidus alkaliphilus]MBB3005400.1 hypothetical protein [Cupriavidus alkaliphilus]MBB3012644.1 hypothetical protein [Cupriavidus alkaliphilus]PVY81880.1 hypothetical protein C7414_101622 [Cupriavidus alkaliphilus]SCB06822.1 hypothetical protein GA0116996_10115 [Cupriavidus alkaliphilus]